MPKFLLLILILSVSGCSFFKGKEDPTINMSAEQLYAEARGAMDSGDYDKAVEYYEKL